MPADYGEVLRDLDAQIANLEAEIATLRAGRPTIVILRNKYSSTVEPRRVEPPHATVSLKQWAAGPYADMGPTAAIRLLLAGQQYALTTGEIVDKLKSGGLTTKGTDLSGNVSSTLSRMKDQRIVEKVNDGWKLKPVDNRTAGEHLQELVNEQRRHSSSASEPLSLQ